MKTRTKALLLTLCAVVMIAGTAYGTYAYLTDSEAATNTFTVGKVGITLDETDVDNSSVGERDTENKYHLIPGHTYVKDPTVHVDADSEPCYLFVKVENGIAAIETQEEGKSIADQMKALNWELIDKDNNVYVLAKGEGEAKFQYTVSGGAEVVVFETFTIDGDKTVNVPTGETAPEGKFDIAAYRDAKVTITGYAIQAAGFADASAAWDALWTQLNPNS